jgi:hypothetical protein
VPHSFPLFVKEKTAMTSENTVLLHLRQWMGGAVPDSELRPLCASALRSMRERLRSGTDADDHRVSAAAAAIALYQYQLKQRISGGALADFKAGDVTIKRAGDPLEAASLLRDEYMRDAAPLLTDTNFAFLRC